MMEEKEFEKVNGGAAESEKNAPLIEDVVRCNVLSQGTAAGAGNVEYDRCPMCDNPTPVGSNGRCKCTSCGHSWTAGSH